MIAESPKINSGLVIREVPVKLLKASPFLGSINNLSDEGRAIVGLYKNARRSIVATIGVNFLKEYTYKLWVCLHISKLNLEFDVVGFVACPVVIVAI